ncbi:T9SS type A sorting domain-containing protein, partial [Patescibacteria group bacterium]|nr:T9SS type A sorting domain-containing protein [Patescibacteria group bacterium]
LTYVWSDSQTGDSINVSPLVTTAYTVVGTDVNGCSASSGVVTVTANPLPNLTTSGNTAICFGDSAQLSVAGAFTYSWTPSAGLDDPNIYNPMASPLSTTTYTITGTIAGCSNTATLTVTVNPLPTASVSNDTTVCAGAPAILYAGGGSAYLWSSGQTGSSINVTPTGTTTYTVTVTALNCSDVASVVVNVIPAPTVTATASGNDTICAGTSIILSASGGDTYTWSDGQSGSSVNVSPLVTTTFMVTGVDVNGCSDVAMVTIEVNPIPSVSAMVTKDSVCINGNVIHLTGQPIGGAWSGTGVNGNYFYPSSVGIAGSYFVTYTYINSFGCSGVDSTEISVIATPVIDTMGYAGNDFMIVGDFSGGPIEIIVGGDHYAPYLVNSTTALFENVVIQDSALVLLLYTNLDGCFTYSSYYTGVNETPIKDEDLKTYPNPFSDILNVEIPDGKYEVILTNMVGQNVQTMTVDGSFIIYRNGLKAGLYLLQIISNGKTISTRVMIQD